jgi:hypothetical protein
MWASGLRIALSLRRVAFTYLAIGGLVWTSAPDHPIVQVGAVALYLATTWICIFWNSRGDARRGAIRAPPAAGAATCPAGLGGGARARRRRDRAERQLVRRGARRLAATPPGASARRCAR